MAKRRSRPLTSLAPLLLLTAMLCVSCSRTSGEDKELKQQIAKFYRLHQVAPPMGALSLSELIKFRPFLSVPLFEKFKNASLAEEAHFNRNADTAAPLFDGDLFTARPQGFAAAQILDCTVDDDKGYCNVELNAAITKEASVIKWQEKVYVTEDERGWVIDDIDFGRNPAPMRQGRLSTLLQAGIDTGRTESPE
ncbi:MAG: hypothetical protein JWP38_411 [Herbaspirillum sp.]|nr:hypothetical protein [Herbaspirillum sp.]